MCSFFWGARPCTLQKEPFWVVAMTKLLDLWSSPLVRLVQWIWVKAMIFSSACSDWLYKHFGVSQPVRPPPSPAPLPTNIDCRLAWSYQLSHTRLARRIARWTAGLCSTSSDEGWQQSNTCECLAIDSKCLIWWSLFSVDQESLIQDCCFIYWNWISCLQKTSLL